MRRFSGTYVNCQYPAILAPPSARRDVLPVDIGPIPSSAKCAYCDNAQQSPTAGTKMLRLQAHSLTFPRTNCMERRLFIAFDRLVLMFLSLFFLCTCTISASWFSEKSAAGFDLSGVIASEANFSKGDFKEVVMSKAYARVSKINKLLGPILSGCKKSVFRKSKIKIGR